MVEKISMVNYLTKHAQRVAALYLWQFSAFENERASSRQQPPHDTIPTVDNVMHYACNGRHIASHNLIKISFDCLGEPLLRWGLFSTVLAICTLLTKIVQLD